MRRFVFALAFLTPFALTPLPIAAQGVPGPSQHISSSPNAATCREVPGGNSLRFVCPVNEPVFEETADPESSPDPPVRISLQLPEGTPLRISLDQRTQIRHVGQLVLGHVVETVYSFDEIVIPAGSIASGRVTRIEPVPTLRRVRAYADGDFSPYHEYAVSFDQIFLPTGEALSIDTTVSPGATEMVHLVTKQAKNRVDEQENHQSVASRAAEHTREEVKDRVQEANVAAHQAADDIRAPGKMHRLKKYLLAQSPYRQQYIDEGTRFNASLNQSLDFGSTYRTREQLSSLGGLPPVDTVLHARLLFELNSATASRGNPVVAQLTRPLYSADNKLLLPSDSRLIGQVLEAKRARHLHRNGELRIIFEHIEVPGGALQSVQGTLEGIEVDRSAHLKLDEEGGAHATNGKARYLSTGMAVLMAAAAAHPDVERGAVDPSGDPAVRAGAGASGFGLAGTVIGLASKSNAVSLAFSAYGASASIYSNFLSRGHDVVLPKNAPLEIGLGGTHASSSQH